MDKRLIEFCRTVNTRRDTRRVRDEIQRLASLRLGVVQQAPAFTINQMDEFMQRRIARETARCEAIAELLSCERRKAG